MLRRIAAALGVASALIAPSADAATIQEFSGFQSATNGIALGPDGNFWVAEQFSGSVARVSPGGQILGRYSVGAGPTSVAAGPGGRVWVAVTDANRLVWFDATPPAPSPHPVPTSCGPVALAAGGDGRMYFSLPCGTPAIGSVAADGTGMTTQTGRGTAYDLVFAAGKLFVPDFDGDAVRRLTPGTLAVEATVNALGNPDGIAADSAGNIWVTLYGTGHVGRFPATQNGGALSEVSGLALTSPFGIAMGPDGRIYVTGKDSHNLTRISLDGTFRSYPTGGEPWDIAAGPDGDVYFTDQASTRVFRFVSTAPRATTGAATAAAATVASATASVDPRGNDTTVVFDYGPTAAYGATSAPITLPAGVGAVPVTAVLFGLAAATTYHVRVRAVNEEGDAIGADTVVTTPPGPVIPAPVLAARANFSWAFIGARTALTRVQITGLRGGETATITCTTKRKGCPFKSKTYRKLKKGKKSLSSLFGRKRKLAKGARIEVRVTAPDAVGSSAVLVIRKRKQDPKITRACIRPGARKTSRC